MSSVIENRESFFERLEPYFSPKVLLDIQLAYTLAKSGHRFQVRKELAEDGTPLRYFEHVRRVTLVLIDEAKIIRREMIIAAILHDGIEDTKEISPAMIEHAFGEDVAVLVKTLSKVEPRNVVPGCLGHVPNLPATGYLDRFFQSVDWRPYAIKACDRIDNLRSMDSTSREFRTKQVVETREKLYPLFDRMVELAPPVEFGKQVKFLRDEVFRLTERHAALLGV